MNSRVQSGIMKLFKSAIVIGAVSVVGVRPVATDACASRHVINVPSALKVCHSVSIFHTPHVWVRGFYVPASPPPAGGDGGTLYRTRIDAGDPHKAALRVAIPFPIELHYQRIVKERWLTVHGSLQCVGPVIVVDKMLSQPKPSE
jgi:hypothetical protein